MSAALPFAHTFSFFFPSDFVLLQIHCPSCKLRTPNTACSSVQRLTFPVQVELQSGHFDVADRLFHHMGELWKGSTQSMGDVKELIPEFYYMDELFVNSSCLPLGTRQNGETVSDVVSPFRALCISAFITFTHALEQFVHTYVHTYIQFIRTYVRTYVRPCIHTIYPHSHTCTRSHTEPLSMMLCVRFSLLGRVVTPGNSCA